MASSKSIRHRLVSISSTPSTQRADLATFDTSRRVAGRQVADSLVRPTQVSVSLPEYTQLCVA